MYLVYKLYSYEGKVLYVGMCKNGRLPYRVERHFLTRVDESEVEAVTFVPARTHEQAARLEREQIQEHDPPYNVMHTTRWRA